jgi:hypothetical protein
VSCHHENISCQFAIIHHLLSSIYKHYRRRHFTFHCDLVSIVTAFIFDTSMLVPDDPDTLGRLIYVVTVETSRPVQVRHT